MRIEEVKDKIVSLLKRGKELAISRRELVQLVGTNDRMIRMAIHELREEGSLIISDTKKGGYYYPATITEAEQYARSMKNRAIQCLEASKAARKSVEKMHFELQQPNLFE